MSSLIRTKRLVLTGLVAAAAMVWPLAQASHANERKPQVPAAIAVPEGNKKFLEAHAVGVQIYSCNGTAWTLAGPRADLYDRRGRLLGTHFAGPTWQANDGSKFVAARAAGVNVDPTAIDWLLLSKVSAEPGPRKRDDLLADTTFIQRINTVGGLAPAAAGCHAGTLGTRVEVPYTADYVFFKARHRCKD
jgi:Protein of unknown function (DUF3455)